MRSTTTRIVTSCAALTLLLLAQARPAEASCLLPGGKKTIGNSSSPWRIKVRLADDATNGFPVIGVSTDEAERRLQHALGHMNAYLGGEVQLDYIGRGCSFLNASDGEICVHAWDCDNGAAACGTSQACATPLSCSGSACTDGWVRIVGGGECASHNVYMDYPYNVDLNDLGQRTAGSEDDMVGTFEHELFHVLGFDHTGTCSQGSQLFSGNTESPLARYPSRDDVEGVRGLYGAASADASYLESTTGFSWTAGSPSFSAQALYRFGSLTYGAVFLGVARTIAQDDLVRFRKLTTSGWQPSVVVDASASGKTFAPSSVAISTVSGKLLLVWLADESATAFGSHLRFAVSNDAGATWPVKGYLTEANGNIVTTTRRAVSVGFDNSSGKFIVVWHNNLDKLSYITMSGNAPEDTATWHRDSFDNLAFDGASVACAGVASSGNDKCIITWTDMQDDYCVSRRGGSIDGNGKFQTDRMMTECFNQSFAVPSVTVFPPLVSTPYEFAWHSPNQTFTFATKGPKAGDFMINEALKTQTQFISPPSLGSWQNGSTSELVVLTANFP